MASAVKAAAFAVLGRFVFVAMIPELFRNQPVPFVQIIIALSILTMTVANLIAIHQADTKRMLAWSSISHAGYLMMAFVLVPQLGSGDLALKTVSGSLIFYLVAYGLSTLLAFGALSRLGAGGNDNMSLDRLSGLSRNRPGTALLLALALFSLAGFPPTVGFFGKFYLFREVLVVSNGKLAWLVVVAVINALFSVYYYLRPIVYMYMKEPDPQTQPGRLSGIPAMVMLAIVGVLVLALGILPSRLSDFSATAAANVEHRHTPQLDSGGYFELAPFARAADAEPSNP